MKVNIVLDPAVFNCMDKNNHNILQNIFFLKSVRVSK